MKCRECSCKIGFSRFFVGMLCKNCFEALAGTVRAKQVEKREKLLKK
ncbi:hypothetical protein KY312_02315 [Candidatus Woesearchaeota archaeon]|nr:hypothetical protein [Candidatus Woesearchaeota archaeon]